VEQDVGANILSTVGHIRMFSKSIRFDFKIRASFWFSILYGIHAAFATKGLMHKLSLFWICCRISQTIFTIFYIQFFCPGTIGVEENIDG
jgi:hypothetical protein